MKIGINLLLWTGCFTKKTVKLIEKGRKLGFDGVELPVFAPQAVDVKATRKALADNGLRATACTIVVAGNMISPSARDRRLALDHLVRVLEVCKACGVECLAGPLFSPLGKFVGRGPNAAEWKRAVTGMRKPANRAESLDIHVGIEPLNRFETYFINICDDAIRMCREVGSPKVGILYDTFHANIEEKKPAEALKKIGKKWLKQVHTCENDRGIPGTGHVPWDATMRALKQMKYDRWVVIESFVPAIKELASAANIWRSLAKDGDDLARRGLRFLRRYIK
ncbi:MAG: sugar phosphate isomerase/epimerase [Planctomycetota bacterium]|nr:MAG: sugar phosphate isomerase/epimerase [Planctomycetota bacterium]